GHGAFHDDDRSGGAGAACSWDGWIRCSESEGDFSRPGRFRNGSRLCYRLSGRTAPAGAKAKPRKPDRIRERLGKTGKLRLVTPYTHCGDMPNQTKVDQAADTERRSAHKTYEETAVRGLLGLFCNFHRGQRRAARCSKKRTHSRPAARQSPPKCPMPSTPCNSCVARVRYRGTVRWTDVFRAATKISIGDFVPSRNGNVTFERRKTRKMATFSHETLRFLSVADRCLSRRPAAHCKEK